MSWRPSDNAERGFHPFYDNFAAKTSDWYAASSQGNNLKYMIAEEPLPTAGPSKSSSSAPGNNDHDTATFSQARTDAWAAKRSVEPRGEDQVEWPPVQASARGHEMRLPAQGKPAASMESISAHNHYNGYDQSSSAAYPLASGHSGQSHLRHQTTTETTSSQSLQPTSPSEARPVPTSSSNRAISRAEKDALPQWFAEMVCYVWFSPSSSNISGTSMPVTPSRSPASTYMPLQSSPLARRNISHGKTRSQDFSFSTLSATPDRQLGPSTNIETHFRVHYDDHRLLPQPRFVAFIRDALGTTQLSTSVLILALLYVRRLKLMHPQIQGQDGSEYRVAVAALMLGNKFLDDHTYTNKTWADISGIALKDVTKLEIEFWLGLQMRIHVGEEDYKSWLRSLEDLAGQRQQLLAKRAQEISRRRLLVSEQASPRATRFRNSISHVVPAVQPMPPSAFNTAHNPAMSHAPAPASSIPGLGDYTDAGAHSPTSQFSFNTSHGAAATGLSPLSDFAHRWSPERCSSSRHVSPFDFNGRLSAASKHLPAWHSTDNSRSQQTTTAGESTRKRRRGDFASETNPLHTAKRTDYGNVPIDTRETTCRATTDAPPHRAHTAHNSEPPHQTLHPSRSSSAFDHSMVPTASSISAESEHLYRSIFAQPLTPEGLMQAYSGPSETSWARSQDRQLSFYQLAAGKAPGLPAYHLPAPVPQGPWAPSASTSGRRGTLSISSPRVPTSASSHNATVSGQYIQHPRLSPEAYGLSYGSHTKHLKPANTPHSIALPNATSTFGVSPDYYRGLTPASSTATPAGQHHQEAEKRWVPFCNVPIAMQLRHYQQWQQLDLPHTADHSGSHGSSNHGMQAPAPMSAGQLGFTQALEQSHPSHYRST
ncbi:unnamed protein product [Sympodiomycopsis kandeliae]